MVKDGFRLRTLREDDLKTVFDWRNSDKIRSNMYNSQLITWEEHRLWYERLANNPQKVCRIFEVGDSPAGLVNFTEIDQANSLCYWGFYLGVSGYPKNTGLIMGFLGLDLAFNEIAIRKLCGECFAFNVASIKFHERLGFKREGYFVEHISRNEKYEDIVRFALLGRDWPQRRQELHQYIFGEPQG